MGRPSGSCASSAGIGRHVVRFVDYDGADLRAEGAAGRARAARVPAAPRARQPTEMPVVEVVGVVTRDDDGARGRADHPSPRLLAPLPHALLGPRAARPRRPAARRRRGAARPTAPGRLLLGRLLALQHALPPRRGRALGVPGGRRDRRAPRRRSRTASAFTTSQIAEENLAGELADVAAELGRPLETAPEETAAELVAALRAPLGRARPRRAVRPGRALPPARAAPPAQRARLRRRGDGAPRRRGGLSAPPPPACRRAGPPPPPAADAHRPPRPGEPGPPAAQRPGRVPRDARAARRAGPCRRRSSPTAGWPRCSSRRSLRCRRRSTGSARRPRSSTRSSSTAGTSARRQAATSASNRRLRRTSTMCCATSPDERAAARRRCGR